MIRFVIAKHNPEVYDKYIGPSLQALCDQHTDLIESYDVCDKDGAGKKNIFAKYNLGVETALKDCIPSDIIVLVHEDVRIEDPLFVEKLLMVFEKKPHVGVVGVVGATELTTRGGWWMHAPQMLRGHVMQENEGKTAHLVKGQVGYFEDMVVVDGLFMAARPAVFDNIRFDDKMFTGNDFYDVTFCVDALMEGHKIAVADILLHHASPGAGVFNASWEEARKLMVSRFEKIGFAFPIRPIGKSKQIEVAKLTPEIEV
jgi:hypothetical protein